MAILKGPIPESFPKNSGYVFRVRNGKCIISSRPQHYTLSNSPKAIRERHHFAFLSKFVKNLRSIKAVEDIWKARSTEKIRNLSNDLRKLMGGLDEAGIPSDDNVLTPDDGFMFSDIEAHRMKGCIKIKINTADFKLKERRRIPMRCAVKGILCYYDARRKLKYPYDFAVIDMEYQPLHLGEPINVIKILDTDEKRIAKRYNRGKLFLVVLISDAENTTTKYSLTRSVIT